MQLPQFATLKTTPDDGASVAGAMPVGKGDPAAGRDPDAPGFGEVFGKSAEKPEAKAGAAAATSPETGKKAGATLPGAATGTAEPVAPDAGGTTPAASMPVPLPVQGFFGLGLPTSFFQDNAEVAMPLDEGDGPPIEGEAETTAMILPFAMAAVPVSAPVVVTAAGETDEASLGQPGETGISRLTRTELFAVDGAALRATTGMSATASKVDPGTAALSAALVAAPAPVLEDVEEPSPGVSGPIEIDDEAAETGVAPVRADRAATGVAGPRDGMAEISGAGTEEVAVPRRSRAELSASGETTTASAPSGAATQPGPRSEAQPVLPQPVGASPTPQASAAEDGTTAPTEVETGSVEPTAPQAADRTPTPQPVQANAGAGIASAPTALQATETVLARADAVSALTSDQGMREVAAAATATVSADTTIHARVETARHVAAQIAEIIHPAGNRSVELTLRPEELGTVRVTLSGEQHNLSVALNVERPETLDLIRRNINMLNEELRQLGYGSVGFSFGADTQGGSTGNDHSGGQGGIGAPSTGMAAEQPVQDQVAQARIAAASDARIDLRL